MQEFEIFDEHGRGRPHDLAGMMDWINEGVENGGIELIDAINVLIDMVRPGQGENSHDVKPLWVGAMYAYGFGPITENIGAMFLNTTPWGFGFAIAVEEGFQFEALAEDAKRAVVKSLCCVLCAGGLNAVVNDQGTISVHEDDGSISEIEISAFRQEIEHELGPDAPDKDNPMRRWGL